MKRKIQKNRVILREIEDRLITLFNELSEKAVFVSESLNKEQEVE